jgi:twitching motility protein PilI
MTAELRALAAQPFALLAAIEARVHSARPDVARAAADVWLGLAFRVRGHWCVAPREDVREILPLPALTRVPGAKPWLLGVANVRGSILAVADLAGYLGLGGDVDSARARVLVFNSTQMPLGLLVDEVGGYRQFVPDDQRAAEASALSPYLLGSFERDGGRWQAFSLHKLATATGFAHAGA